jgi:hypothetical protein
MSRIVCISFMFAALVACDGDHVNNELVDGGQLTDGFADSGLSAVDMDFKVEPDLGGLDMSEVTRDMTSNVSD